MALNDIRDGAALCTQECPTDISNGARKSSFAGACSGWQLTQSHTLGHHALETRSSDGEFADHCCASPSRSDPSGESMSSNIDNSTPPELTEPIRESLSAHVTAANVGGALIDSIHQNWTQEPPCGKDMTPTPPSVCPIRTKRVQLAKAHPTYVPGRFKSRSDQISSPRPSHDCRHDAFCENLEGSTSALVPNHSVRVPNSPKHRDSGYETAPSRANTMVHQSLLAAEKSSNSTLTPSNLLNSCSNLNMAEPKQSNRFDMVMQPGSTPIPHEQLAAEVKGIYASLVTAEESCIKVAALHSADTSSELEPEQWQKLIALHRTLLFEHHDFLMVTQHPSATDNLRSLAMRYNMPARMWKHAIHGFLEVLRHRRPASQEYMIAFIYLAYQMMSLLFETVPAFTDTWIECLGDLARYRMAIEEDKDTHATWAGVAARWYTITSDRHPSIGRLYHHLGILAPPSLRKLCLYAKSILSVIPFPNAQDSLNSLCAPLVHSQDTINNSRGFAEARIVTFHALCYSNKDIDTIKSVGSDALSLIQKLNSSKRFEMGAYLAVVNIAGVLQLGNHSNLPLELYNAAIQLAIQKVRPPAHPEASLNLDQLRESFSTHTPGSSLQASLNFCYDCFNEITGSHDPQIVSDSLPFVHVMLVWFHSLHTVQSRINDYERHINNINTWSALLLAQRINWGGLANFLNILSIQNPSSARVVQCAKQGIFLCPERKEDSRPLSEDYLMRGSIWAAFYFDLGWFEGSEDESRTVETELTKKLRADRVLWLGHYLVFHIGFLSYDGHSKKFRARQTAGSSVGTETMAPATISNAMDTTTTCSERMLPAGSPETQASGSPERLTSKSSNESDYERIPSVAASTHTAHTIQSSRSWAKVTAGEPNKRKSTKAARVTAPGARSSPIRGSIQKPKKGKGKGKEEGGTVKIRGSDDLMDID